MFDIATYRLISTESETPRPRVLREGSLVDCLDELKEAVLNDVIGSNVGALKIVAQVPDEPAIEVLAARTTGQGY